MKWSCLTYSIFRPDQECHALNLSTCAAQLIHNLLLHELVTTAFNVVVWKVIMKVEAAGLKWSGCWWTTNDMVHTFLHDLLSLCQQLPNASSCVYTTKYYSKNNNDIHQIVFLWRLWKILMLCQITFALVYSWKDRTCTEPDYKEFGTEKFVFLFLLGDWRWGKWH